MKKNNMSLQDLNYNNAGLYELTFNEMEMIDGGKINLGKLLAGVGMVIAGLIVGNNSSDRTAGNSMVAAGCASITAAFN